MSTYTLITGASTGLGSEFARLAARDGRNIILTARSQDKLNTLAEEIRAQYDDVDVVVIPADLGTLDGAQALWRQASQMRQIDVFVNNAGMGLNTLFELPMGWKRELETIELNIIAYTYLMKQAAAHMQAFAQGRILNVASLAAFQPGPGMAVYHATKAYALSLSDAVREEIRGAGVTVTTLCPGPTQTDFFDGAHMHGIRLLSFMRPMKAFDVAEEGWLEARIGKRVVVPGVGNKLMRLLVGIVPRSWTNRVTMFLMSRV